MLKCVTYNGSQIKMEESHFEEDMPTLFLISVMCCSVGGCDRDWRWVG